MLSVDEQMRIITSGAAKIVPEADLRKKLEKGEPLNIKLGVDRTPDAGFSSQFGNTLRIIAEQLGRQVHPPRTEFAQPGKRGPIRAEHRRRHVKRHAQLASDHHLSQVAADDAPGTLHK